jgi:hypothetical protein
MAASSPLMTLDGKKAARNPPGRRPRAIWITPASTTARRNVWNDPRARSGRRRRPSDPAAGPLTLVCDPLSAPTRMPPTIPATSPANSGALDARAIPRHRGRRRGTRPARPSGRGPRRPASSRGFRHQVFARWRVRPAVGGGTGRGSGSRLIAARTRRAERPARKGGVRVPDRGLGCCTGWPGWGVRPGPSRPRGRAFGTSAVAGGPVTASPRGAAGAIRESRGSTAPTGGRSRRDVGVIPG